MAGDGFHGLGGLGLQRRSTWLRPVATFADLPVPAPPGAAAFTLDTVPPTPWEFDAVSGTWILFGTGGGGPFSIDADRIVTADSTDVFSTDGDEVPLVVIDDNGNVVIDG